MSTDQKLQPKKIKNKKNRGAKIETRSIIFDSFYFLTLFALFTLYYASTSVLFHRQYIFHTKKSYQARKNNTKKMILFFSGTSS